MEFFLPVNWMKPRPLNLAPSGGPKFPRSCLRSYLLKGGPGGFVLSGDGASLTGSKVAHSARTVASAIKIIVLSTSPLSASARRTSGKCFLTLARGAAGNILMTRSGVNCDTTDASLKAAARFIGSYASENATFRRASNSGAIKPSVRMALSAPIIRDDDSTQGLKVNAQQTI